MQGASHARHCMLLAPSLQVLAMHAALQVGDLTGVLELLDEIDVDGVRGSIANATQLFNNIGALITEQTGNIGEETMQFCN